MDKDIKHLSQAQQRRLVERWRSSGLTAREFSGREGINIGRLWAWSSKMRRETTPAAAPMTRSAEPMAPRMLPVRVTTGADAHYEIVTTSGRVVRASGDFDPMTLARLATALESGC